MNESETEHLFSYGTLQREDVQLATFNRRLDGAPDSLVGYKLTMVQVDEQAFAATNGRTQRNALFTGNPSDSIQGFVFSVSQRELEHADTYEPEDYERVVVQLRSGLKAWLYLKAH